MKYTLVCALSLITAVAAVSPAAAQRRRPGPQTRGRHESAITVNRGYATIEPFAGYLITPSFFSGPLNTTLGATNAPLYGARLSIPLAPSASIIGTAGYSSGTLRVGVPFLGGYNFGKANTWVFDGSVELRADNMARNGGRIIPFAQLGGGALRREVGISGLNTHATNFTVSGGVGVDIPLSRSADISVLAKDYYGKADFGSVGSLDVTTKDIHTIGLTGGLRISF